MSTIPYYTTLPPFQDQALLSATRVNQMLSNLDAVYGLDQRMVTGQLFGCTSDINRSWKGWVAYNGDQLKIALPTPTNDAGTTVVFDDSSKVHRFSTHYPHGTAGGLKTIPIPQDKGYENYGVYRVYVDNDPPTYAYMTNSAAASIGAMPTFANGEVSTAADFNAIITATEQLGEQFNQPIISGTRWMTPNWLNDNPEWTIRTYAPYRHTWFEFYLTATSSTGDNAHADFDVLKWEVYDNTSTWRTFWSKTLERHGATNEYSPDAPERVKLTDYASLTVGNWYAFRFSHVMDQDSHRDGVTRLYWYGQQRNETAALWTPQKRWALGDVVNGDGVTNPRLDIMSANLAYLNSRRNTINPVMRQATNNREDDDSGHYNNPVFARRVHRWLAYENSSYDDPATNENEGEATLYYSVGKPNIFASVNLTKTYTTAYLDLDTTPVKPGMIFYVYNCNYAIQVPDHP